MTRTLEGREAPQAAAMGAIRSSEGAPEALHLRRARTNGDRPSSHETGPAPGGPLNLIPYAYRDLLRKPNSRRFLTGLGVSSLGDAMSTVTVAWLAVLIAPADHLGVFVGLAVAAYTLAGVIGAVALSPVLRHRPSRTLVMIHCLLRSGLLATIVLLRAAGALSPETYIVLLAGSSLLSSWGNAGQYTMLAELAGPAGRLAANSSFSTDPLKLRSRSTSLPTCTRTRNCSASTGPRSASARLLPRS